MNSSFGSCPSFSRVAILGVGLLGASLGLALKRRQLAGRVVGLGRPHSTSLATALRLGAIDEFCTDPAQAVREADLVVLCLPVRRFPETLDRIAPALAPGVLVTDVGSTKAYVLDQAACHLPACVAFVGSHPMAGSEKRGPAAARSDLFDNALCLVTPGVAPEPAVARIEALWRHLGMRTLRTDPVTHDRWVASVSHLPHVLASALVTAAADRPEALQAASTGFLDTTRIASGDLEMWTDILLTNPGPILEAMDNLSTHLARLRQALAQADEPALRQHLAHAKATRDALLKQRQNSGDV